MFPQSDAAAQAEMPLLAGLNPEQRAAVTLPPEPALILAGAGFRLLWKGGKIYLRFAK